MPEKTGNVLSWASELDDNALEQAQRVARMPFLAGHLALMPDAHWGMGATIGSVIPTVGAIIPSAVGVDIGCGMIAVSFRGSIAAPPLHQDDLPDDLSALHSAISRAVPSGVGKGHKGGNRAIPAIAQRAPLDQWQIDKATNQMGTLGSGNHFVEICADELGYVWIVLHSGSRGIGNELAKVHIDGAKKLMKQYFVQLEDPDLAYFVEDTPEFWNYIAAMHWAQDYALMNREVMMDAVIRCLADACGREHLAETQRINCHHNFTAQEHHHGRNIWVTRKGAIRARGGDLGVIPGSMGTSSYIVHGLGNVASYDSAPHGAGRRMSRGAARKNLDLATLDASMSGVTWNHDPNLIDEDPRAYKDIDQVMADSEHLVCITHSLTQLLNYKGT